MGNWKRAAWVLWLCNFILSAAMNMVLPFLSLFLFQMGVTSQHELSFWTGATFSATFLSGAILAPVWGIFADKYGQRANLIRAGLGMGLITFLMAFTGSPWMLLVLRFLMGFFSGFITVSFSYLSRITPTEHSGEALGLLQTGGIAGGIIGPLIGGGLSDAFGFQMVFAITGISICLTLFLVIFFIEKDPVVKQESGKQGSFREVFFNPNLMFLFITTFLLQAAVLSTNSMMTIFVQSLVGAVNNLAFLSGLATSVTGVATIIGSPYLGKLGDRMGQEKILPTIMLICGLLFLPQIWTHTIHELYVWRFIQGLLLGGIWPAIQALIHKRTPSRIQGRAFGVTASSRFLGNLMGPIIGGIISGHYAPGYVFAASGLLLIMGSIILKLKVVSHEVPKERHM